MARGQWLGFLWTVIAAALADSWTAYQEQPCCRPAGHHRVRHHRGKKFIICQQNTTSTTADVELMMLFELNLR